MSFPRNETSQIILNAAFACIASKGCASVSLRDIAEEAGVALSQLNYYFKNKEGLFSEVLRGMRRDYLQEVEKNLGGLPTVQEKIIRLIQLNKDLLVTNRDLYRAFLEFFNLAMWSPSFKEEMNFFLTEISQAITSQLGKEIQSPEAPSKSSPIVLTKLILGASFGVAMQYLMAPEHEEVLIGLDALEGLV